MAQRHAEGWVFELGVVAVATDLFHQTKIVIVSLSNAGLIVTGLIVTGPQR